MKGADDYHYITAIRWHSGLWIDCFIYLYHDYWRNNRHTDKAIQRMIPIVETKADRALFYGTHEWKAKRQEILERDNYECVKCKDNGYVTTQSDSIIEVDHILELKDRPDLALNSDNMQLLCKSHHNQKHKRFNFRPKQKENEKKQKFPESFK